MPRDGSLILSDVRGPTLALVCEACGRRGRYNVERLIAQHGDMLGGWWGRMTRPALWPATAM